MAIDQAAIDRAAPTPATPLAARETLGSHTNFGLLPRALAELIVAARETLGSHTNSGLLPRALAELIVAALVEPAPCSCWAWPAAG